ncbi:hypothetical protein [Arenibacter sp. ARW7G5Y1]|nr:hypothetical protein [Arenibacter sp. ARW7G5Y1]
MELQFSNTVDVRNNLFSHSNFEFVTILMVIVDERGRKLNRLVISR